MKHWYCINLWIYWSLKYRKSSVQVSFVLAKRKPNHWNRFSSLFCLLCLFPDWQMDRFVSVNENHSYSYCRERVAYDSKVFSHLSAGVGILHTAITCSVMISSFFWGAESSVSYNYFLSITFLILSTEVNHTFSSHEHLFLKKSISTFGNFIPQSYFYALLSKEIEEGDASLDGQGII